MTDSTAWRSGLTKALSSRTLAFRSSTVIWAIGRFNPGLEAAVHVKRKRPAELLDLRPDLLQCRRLAAMTERLVDPSGQVEKFRLAQAARGDRGGADPDSAGHGGRAGVIRDGVLVNGDSGFVERRLGVGSRVPRFAEVHQQQMVVRAPRDQAEAALR